jgi:membrane protein DedA with SNARE-associated domain
VSTAIGLLTKHGYLILFLSVMAEQCGLPLPATPILIAAGALAGLHGHHAAHALIVAVTASLISDSLWFWFGRRGKSLLLKALSKMPLEPGTYLSRARSVYSRHGSGAILAAKFVPGLNAVVLPLAGFSKLSWGRFLFLDSAAALLWAGAYMSLGWVFRGRIGILTGFLEHFSIRTAILVATLLSFYLLRKYRNRQRIDGGRGGRLRPLESLALPALFKTSSSAS